MAPSFEEVMRGPLIGLPAANPLQTLIDEQARILGVSPAYRVRLPTLNAVYAVASTGAGAAIVPYGTVSRSPTLPAAIHPVAEEWADRRALLITRSTYVPSPAQQEFIDALLRYRDEVDVTEPLGVVILGSPLSKPAAGSEPDTRSTPVGDRAVRQARKGPRHQLVSVAERNDSLAQRGKIPAGPSNPDRTESVCYWNARSATDRRSSPHPLRTGADAQRTDVVDDHECMEQRA